jgi:hypothetical protein
VVEQVLAAERGGVRTAGASIHALEEAIPIIRGALDGERVIRGPGPYYPVPGYPSGPVPERRIQLWLGVYRRRGRSCRPSRRRLGSVDGRRSPLIRTHR